MKLNTVMLVDANNAAPAPHGAMAPETVQSLVCDERGRWRLGSDAAGYVRNGELITAPQDLGATGPTVSLNWVEQWTAPLRYEKYASNPVYGPQQSGAWDTWTNGVSIVPTADGKTYRMYYAGRKGAGIGLAEAAIANPLSWKEHPASPVLVPREDNWEGNQINQPRVVKVTDMHWRMYYTGWGFPGPDKPKALGSPWAMNIAESFDGGTIWKRLRDEPIMERGGAGSPDDGAACVPMVIRVGDEWMMWYTAGQIAPDGQLNVHLCLATSPDGVWWEKYAGNPVLTDQAGDTPHIFASRCYVRHDDGVFRMWYSYSMGQPSYRIRYAESLDGIHWERAPIAPVLNASPTPAWDDMRVEYPEVQVVDGAFRLWFCGNEFGSVGYATGVIETGVDVSVRSGDTAIPDTAWSPWNEVRRHGSQPSRRYIQVRAALWTRNSGLSPALNTVELNIQD